MTNQELDEVVIATMKIVRTFRNIESMPNYKIIENVKRLVSDVIKLED